MKLTTFALALVLPSAIFAQDPDNPYLSLQLEIERAIKRGNEFLKTQQQDGTHWGDPTLPALSALPLTAAMGDPAREGAPAPYVEAGYKWLLSNQKDDGGGAG